MKQLWFFVNLKFYSDAGLPMANELFEMAKELQLDVDARRRRKIFAESWGRQNIEEAYAL